MSSRIRRETTSASALVVGFRFFALAAVSGTATLMARSGISVPLVFAGVLFASALAALQHFAVSHGSRRVGSWFVWLHVGSWTFLLHATGGQGSPLVLGYLLELPLSGALLGKTGVALATLAATLFYCLYAIFPGGPFEPRTAATFLAVQALCALITWRVVGMMDRQRTQLERSQQTLAHRAATLEEDLRLLGDSLDDALVTIDGQGRIAGLNPASASLLRVDPVEALGKPWQQVLHLDPVSRTRLVETLDRGTAHHGVPMVLSHGSREKVTVRAGMWRGGGRDAPVVLLLAPGPPSALDDPVRRLGESAACVAHQIKNSMASIQGFVSSMRGPGTRSGGLADECLGALHGLGDLAEDVLVMAGTQRPHRERIAIHDVLRSAIVLLGQPPIRLSLPGPPLYVEAPRSPLVHAIFNLLDNAVRASRPGEAVRVSIEKREDRVIIDIADAGPGMPDETASQRGPLPARGGGSGWGLMAARRFIDACGGRLSLAAGEGGGTRCRLELPAAPQARLAEVPIP